MDLVSWGVIISACLKHGLNDDVLSLFFYLFRGDCMNKPDEYFILGTVLNACANAALIRQCRCIHSLVVRTGHGKHLCVASALVDSYAKCGDIASAKSAFAVVSSVSADAILHNTMLKAYGNHGLIDEALSLYQEMTRAQLPPTPATFVAVVSACSHFGLVEQGKKLLFNLDPENGAEQRWRVCLTVQCVRWRWQSAQETRRRMAESQVQKVQAYSRIVI